MKLPIKNMVAVLLLIMTFPIIAEPTATNHSIPLEKLQHFVDVYHQVKTRYVNQVNDELLIERAIKGMLQNLDPHSDYLDQAHYKKLQDNTSGEFAGLGVEVIVEGDYIKIITPINGSPADRVGLQTGDLIIKVNDTSLQGSTRRNVLNILHGPKGSNVKLLVLRGSTSEPIEFIVKREIIKIDSVTHKRLANNTLYLKINQFQQRTSSDFAKIIRNEISKKKAGANGIIIDLRNNPGGLLNPALEIADYLIPDGLITFMQGQLPINREEVSATPITLIDNIPIVVIINGGTASSSEVLAGALQDHKKAIIVGTASFGKGSIQTLIPLHNGSALKLTTATYYTPLGRSIQAQGIQPDIIITEKTLTLKKGQPIFKESSLRGHLKNKTAYVDQNKKEDFSLKGKDYQLYEALNILRAISLVQKMGNNT